MADDTNSSPGRGATGKPGDKEVTYADRLKIMINKQNKNVQDEKKGK